MTLLAAVTLTVPFAAAVSQPDIDPNLGDVRAFVALRATHIGAFAPMLTPAMASRRLNGAQLGLRYGIRLLDSLEVNTLAVQGTFALGLQSSMAVTAGLTYANCDGCDPAMMLGVGGDMRLYQTDASQGSSFTVAVSGDIGYAQVKPGDESAFALGVGVPVTYIFGATPEGIRFAPFFTPIFGVGSTTGGCPVAFPDCEESGTRWVLGGGVGVWGPRSPVSVSIGINQVMLSGAKPVYGVNVQIGGR